MAGQPEPLTTWRGCALYAKSLLEHAQLDPNLHPHLQAFQSAVTLLLSQDAAAPPAFPPAAQPAHAPQEPPPAQASPWASQAQPSPPAQVQASPWGAQAQPAPAAVQQAPAWAAQPVAAQQAPAWAQPAAQPVADAPAQPAAQPAGPVTTQAETPVQPLRVFAYGRNDKGTLGQGFFRPPGWEPCREVTSDGEVVVWARGGRVNTAFLTQSGQLRLSGSNASYLFMDRESRGRESPTVPDLLKGRAVSRVFFGTDATHIFAVLDGRLHAWGRVANALGIDTRSPTLEPKPVERIGGTSQSGGVGGDAIRQMVLSTGHSVALLPDGSLAMSGGNTRGQLGMGAKNNPYEVFVFTAPEQVAGIRFSQIACSTLHTAAVSDQGELFTCGRNDSGELGHERLEDHYKLTRVSSGSLAGRRVAQVTCSDSATLCITDDGMLHGSGSNGRGELGLGSTPQTSAFVHLPLPGGRTAKQVAAGQHHVLVLTSDGALFAWGDNNYAQVTPGEKSRYVTSPVEVQGFADQTVLGISTGESHCMVMVAHAGFA